MPPFLFLFSVSKVGLRLMGDTAGTKLRETIETRGLSLLYDQIFVDKFHMSNVF